MLLVRGQIEMPAGLWSHRDFVKLWAGQTVSVFGSLISRTALPFAAILFLNATPVQIALMGVADLLPGFLVGLFAGAWADRCRRRPMMIRADLGRAALLATVPVAAWVGVLRVEQLYVVGFLAGILTMFFDVAYEAYLPTLVSRDELVEGNSKLTASACAAEVAAFGLSGWLVQWLGAPLAVLADGLSFLVSALFLRSIQNPEPPREEAADGPDLRREVVDGLRLVLQHPLLRILAAATIILDFSFRIFGTVFLIYVTRELGFKPGPLGMIFAVGGVTSLIGAALTGQVTARLGVGQTMALGVLLTSLGALCTVFAHGPTPAAAVLLIANQLLTDPGYTLFHINQVSLRQAIASEETLGRVNATIRVASLGAMLVATLLAGYLGERIGLRATMALGACGPIFGALHLALSPVGRLRKLPALEPG